MCQLNIYDINMILIHSKSSDYCSQNGHHDSVLQLLRSHKSHLFNHKGEKFAGNDIFLASGIVVFISETCRSCHTH